MKVLVTGAAGYVGTTLCKYLLDQNIEVVALDNFNKGHHDALIPLTLNKNFSFIHEDIRNKYFKTTKVDYIIHLAALVGFPACAKNPHDSYSINVLGTKNVIDYGIPTIFASTGSVYGKLDEICTENSQTNPLSLYGQHKLEAEYYVINAPNTVSLRFATGMGVSPNPRVNLLVNDLVYQAVTKKTLTIFESGARRTFINVYDMARSLYHALLLLSNNIADKVYNVGDNNLNLTKKQLVDLIKEKTNCYVTYQDFDKDQDARDYEVSYDKFKETGFVIQYNMEQTIDQLIKAIPLMKVENYQ